MTTDRALPLFDPPPPIRPTVDVVGEPAARILGGERGKRDGMARAFRHADEAWLDAAWSAACDVAEVCRERAGDGVTTFTTDDVWALLDARGVPAPREPRALGPVMRRLVVDTPARARRTSTVVKSTRPECHRREVAVYEVTDRVVR